jgi:mRNA interferase MazF
LIAGRPPYQPDRGHFVFLNFTPHAGTEQDGRRPALVLSPLAYNIATGRAFACPLTTQVKGSPFEVRVPPGSWMTGVILADQARNLDWIARDAEFVVAADERTMLEVLARIEAILQITLLSDSP